MQADGVLPECSCDAKTVFNDLKGQLQQEHNEDKDSALKSLEERVWTRSLSASHFILWAYFATE